MSEIRRDAISDRWVIVAANRAGKPAEFVGVGSLARCPFCKGHEADTPDTVAIYYLPGQEQSGDWQVRVVPNKYPAVTPGDANGQPPPDLNGFASLHSWQAGAG